MQLVVPTEYDKVDPVTVVQEAWLIPWAAAEAASASAAKIRSIPCAKTDRRSREWG
jgi:hypothetical protein